MTEEAPEQLSPDIVADLDFLPASYRQKIHKRQKQLWRRGILGVFLVLIIIGSLQQQRTHGRHQEQLDELRTQVTSMMAPLQDPQLIQTNIDNLDRQCTLVSQLRIRVATTQLIAAISRQRPQFVSLSDIQFTHETNATPAESTKADDKRPTSSSNDKQPQDPFQLDLVQLNSRRQRQILIINISGMAPNHLAVSQYMAALQSTGLFAQLWLISNEPHTFAQQKRQSFTIRIQVRQPIEKLSDQLPEDRNADSPQPVALNTTASLQIDADYQ